MYMITARRGLKRQEEKIPVAINEKKQPLNGIGVEGLLKGDWTIYFVTMAMLGSASC